MVWMLSNKHVYEKKRLAFYIWSRESLYYSHRLYRLLHEKVFFLFDREEELR